MADWRPVVGWESRYEVSSAGGVRKIGGQEIGQWLNSNGYSTVRLSQPRVTRLAHRLVAMAFTPNPDSLPTINHIDFDRTNNCVENLEWCTQKSNLEHSAKYGRMQRDYWCGKISPQSKLTDEQVQMIRSLRIARNIPYSALAVTFAVSKRTIGRLLHGKSYARVQCQDSR